MLRIPCPKCGKNSYTTDVESFNPCPYCGSLFSGKYGFEKRRETRVEKEIPFVFSYQGQSYDAVTSDFSEGGVGIQVFGESPIASTDDVLSLTIGERRITAKIVWVKKLPNKSLAGLHRVN